MPMLPGPFSRRSDEDERSVAEAMELTSVAHIAHQSVLTLSGGELQRVFLAQLFVHRTRGCSCLTSPTNDLDLVYRKAGYLSLVREWLLQGRPRRGARSCTISRSRGCTEAVSMLLDHGRIAAAGEAADVFAPETLNAVYRMDVADWMRTSALPNGKSEESSKAPPEPRRRFLRLL